MTQWIVPLVIGIVFSAMWYFRLGSWKTRERRALDLLIGWAVITATIPLRLLVGPLPSPQGVPSVIAFALAVGSVVLYFTGHRRASWFCMMALVAVGAILSITRADTPGPWWFGVIMLGVVAAGLLLKRWRAV